jgi:hypothetical protein
MPMKNRYVIVIEKATRDHIKELAKKSQTYDDFINELLLLKEQRSED